MDSVTKGVRDMTCRDAVTHMQQSEMYAQECEKLLAEKKIEVGGTTVENRPAPALQRRDELKIQTNMYKVDVKKPIEYYQYQVTMTGSYDKNVQGRQERVTIEFSQDGSGSFQQQELREICQRVFLTMIKIEQFKPKETSMYYDLRSLLYSSEKLDECSVEIAYEQIEGVDIWNPSQVAAFRRCRTFTVVLSFVERTIDSDLGNAARQLDLARQDVGFIRFLDVVSSQDVIRKRETFVSFPNGVAYFMNPEKHGYNTRQLDVGNGVFLAPGVTKSSRLIEDADKSFGAALIVGPKLSPWHQCQSVYEKVQHMFGRDPNDAAVRNRIEALIRNLYVYPVHLFDRDNTRMIVAKIRRLGAPANQQSFEMTRDGVAENITLQTYYQRVHNTRLLHPDVPTLVVRQGYNRQTGTADEVFYPMELCELLDNQRVATSAQTGEVTAALIKQCAVLPRQLAHRIDQSFQALNLHNSAYLASAELQAQPHPIKIHVPKIQHPDLRFKNGLVERYNERDATWSMVKQFHTPAYTVSPKWAAYVAIRQPDGRNPFGMRELEQFCKSFVNNANRKGLPLGMPHAPDVLIGQGLDKYYKQLNEKIREAATAGCAYILVITDKRDTDIHRELKAFEQQTGVVTQNVTTIVALKAAGIGVPRPSNLSMDNIVHKANVKQGGLNYMVATSSNWVAIKQLTIGICVNHVAAGMGALDASKAPTVIGLAANDLANPSAYTGDYVYQTSNRELDLKILEPAIGIILERYAKSHKGEPPESVVIYRNGVSEGQYPVLMQYEIPLLRHIMKTKYGSSNKLVYIVCSRLHNVRLMPDNITGERAREQNVPTGIVVDRQITSPLVPEFYLASHKAQQGTSKIPRYAVLCNDAKANMEAIENLTYHLAFNHQIIGSPVSTPSPVYIAEEYAKRGRNIYNADSNRVRHVNDMIQLANEFAYQKWADMRDRRINA